MVCVCVLHRGQRGEGWCVSSTLCRYDIRMGRDCVWVCVYVGGVVDVVECVFFF